MNLPAGRVPKFGAVTEKAISQADTCTFSAAGGYQSKASEDDQREWAGESGTWWSGCSRL